MEQLEVTARVTGGTTGGVNEREKGRHGDYELEMQRYRDSFMLSN